MKNRKIKAVVFDMDGTMFNTEDIYDKVSHQVLGRRDQEFTQELKLKMMGLPSHQAFQVMIDYCQLMDSVHELADETHELFAELLPRQIEMMPGLRDLITHLEDLKIPKAVATSSSRRFAQLSLHCTGIEQNFEFVLTCEDVVQGKPEPDIYHLAANRFEIQTAEMLVLEDSPIGTRAGVSAGAMTVAVPCEHTKSCDFSHVRYQANSLNDPLIYELLEQTIGESPS